MCSLLIITSKYKIDTTMSAQPRLTIENTWLKNKISLGKNTIRHSECVNVLSLQFTGVHINYNAIFKEKYCIMCFLFVFQFDVLLITELFKE